MNAEMELTEEILFSDQLESENRIRSFPSVTFLDNTIRCRECLSPFRDRALVILLTGWPELRGMNETVC